MVRRTIWAALALICILSFSRPAGAAGCPSEPDWSYSGANGPSNWNTLFPIQCGTGSRQSPFDIVTANVTKADLPKLSFHYNVADVLYLDHDDQVAFNHGNGNFIKIGKDRFDLINIHEHTPSEYTLNGQQFPMEIHLVHQNKQTGQLAVIGVFVVTGKENKGVKEAPSFNDPSTVALKLTGLIPKKRNYVRFNGSLTTPGENIALPRCAEGVLWTEMLTPIAMSSDQIAAFQDSAQVCWGTSITNRPLQPSNNRFLLSPRNVDP
ncbi:carbonic anhydrase [Methylococcus capsulatus str. Bath]|uniref:carbonic anhydrase n=1 Tax=Methylococcus capsulatus (strain ATCC 33009 / NCIMB 11132 / Bath) TaxID=243233 RepID=Q609Z4_METCA|nr:carbonic anhydrase family protein [Methylococcus capsulatus]AAU92649.1 carbonic anhydrase [Methylococcus capsulatus str. Bath]